ncbi:MAG TPA: hypothetical protein VFH08_05170 [Chitinophagaceae bacterium]|nr:hypothetical protein [Chitinophagaceae bacterium]
MKNVIVFIFILIASGSYSQNPLQPILKTYFRVHPFDIRFSSFITSLQQDPWFTAETYDRRTDSSFFFLSGTYKNFNPLRYLPKELKLVVAEEEIIHSDLLKTPDTIINLQLMGLTDTGIVYSNAVEKEFRRFHNNHEHRFSKSVHQTFDGIGEVYYYFLSPLSIPPVSIAWGRLETNQYTFTLTIRFKIKENMANFIVAPGEF